MTKTQTIDLADLTKKDKVTNKNRNLKDINQLANNLSNKTEDYKDSIVVLKIDLEDGRNGELALYNNVCVEDTCRKFCRRYRLNFGTFGKN